MIQASTVACRTGAVEAKRFQRVYEGDRRLLLHQAGRSALGFLAALKPVDAHQARPGMKMTIEAKRKTAGKMTRQ
jgi:hypothetical protein